MQRYIDLHKPKRIANWKLIKPSVFTNMYYLFSRLLKEYDFSYFPWIIWYIWKNRNSKLFKNQDGNSQKILRIAEVESDLWAEAQLTIPQRSSTTPQILDWHSMGAPKICFVDGVWKEHDNFQGKDGFIEHLILKRRW